MLQNAYFLAKIGADIAENERHFAEIFAGLTSSRPRRRSPHTERDDPRDLAAAPVRWAAMFVLMFFY